MSLLREYTLGDKPIQIELLSDPDEGKATGVSYVNLPPFQRALFSMFIASQQSTTKTPTLTSQFLFSQFTETMMTHKALGQSVLLVLRLYHLAGSCFPIIRKALFVLSICCQSRDSSITSERLSFPSAISLPMESLYDQYFCVKEIRTWVCTGLEMSKMQGCILSSGVTAFECICQRIRVTGSTCCSCTKIGAEWLLIFDCLNRLTRRVQGQTWATRIRSGRSFR